MKVTIENSRLTLHFLNDGEVVGVILPKSLFQRLCEKLSTHSSAEIKETRNSLLKSKHYKSNKSILDNMISLYDAVIEARNLPQPDNQTVARWEEKVQNE